MFSYYPADQRFICITVIIIINKNKMLPQGFEFFWYKTASKKGPLEKQDKEKKLIDHNQNYMTL